MRDFDGKRDNVKVVFQAGEALRLIFQPASKRVFPERPKQRLRQQRPNPVTECVPVLERKLLEPPT
ncbi:hypothetical protein LJK88_21000 [Paenibacillus sp. P26]|nr:hypothetical protein LJK88_21000 [Paenibacillus sp. P26]